MKYEFSKSFFKRVFWSKQIVNLSMYISLFFIIGLFVDDIARLLLFLIGGLNFFIRLLILFFDNIRSISYLEIDFENRLLIYEIKKYDIAIHNYTLSIDEVQITIKESFLLDIYNLQISHHPFKFNQKEIAGWTKDMFKKVVIESNNLKGKKPYLSYVR